MRESINDDAIGELSLTQANTINKALIEEFLKTNYDSKALIKEFAVFLFEKNEFKHALIYLNKARDAAPENLQILSYLMRAHWALSDHQTAGDLAGLIVEKEPGNVEALRVLARRRTAARTWREAAQLWRRVGELAPQDREAHLQLARAGWQLGDFDLAETASQAVLDLVPDNFECLDIRVKSLFRQRRFEALADLLPRYARSDWERAAVIFTGLEAADAAGPLSRVLAELVSAEPPLEAAGQWAARSEFNWLADAATMESWGDVNSAAEFLAAVLTVFPANKEARQALKRLSAQALKRMREAQDANAPQAIMDAAREVLALDPHAAEAHFGLGRQHLVSGAASEAIEHLRAAVAREPDNAWFQLNLARAAERCGRPDEAVKAFLRVCRAEKPNEAYAKEAMGSLDRIYADTLADARDLLRQEQFATARARLDLVARIRPDAREVETLREAIQQRM